MKRFYLTIVAALFAMCAFAEGIEIVQGEASFMKRTGSIAVVFNWKDAKWDKRIPVREEWKDEYQTYVDRGEESFVKGFNKSSKKMKIAGGGSPADYVMTVNFLSFDKFFSATSIVPGFKHCIWAEIVVTDKSTGEMVCTYRAERFKGGRDFSIFDSFTESMEDLGSRLPKTH